MSRDTTHRYTRHVTRKLTPCFQLTEVKEEYTRLCKIRDNNWVTPEPPKPKSKTPRKGEIYFALFAVGNAAMFSVLILLSLFL